MHSKKWPTCGGDDLVECKDARELCVLKHNLEVPKNEGIAPVNEPTSAEVDGDDSLQGRAPQMSKRVSSRPGGAHARKLNHSRQTLEPRASRGNDLGPEADSRAQHPPCTCSQSEEISSYWPSQGSGKAEWMIVPSRRCANCAMSWTD